MKALVQGASGFVASYLLPRLATVGIRQIVCVDRKPPCHDSLLHCLGDGTDFILTDRLSDVIGFNVDLIISLAGVTDVDYALREPASAFAGNVGIAIDLAEWMRTTAPSARCIYLSTDEVLGVSYVPVAEDGPHRATQPYAASKAAAETILHNYRDVYGLDIVTLRSCNLVGGHQRAFKIIPVAVQHLTDGLPVPIYGSGCQRREWMSVEDLCCAILRLCDRSVAKGVYQAASGLHLSVLEVVHQIADALGCTPAMHEVADRQVHDACYAMSSRRLRELGWRPRIDPREAITQAVREMSAEVREGRFQLVRN
jgi:dTDP-glucose 4,6-dehydratase